MAWRPSEYLVEGLLDNTEPNRVIGFILFQGGKELRFDLEGDFHRDIRRAKIKLTGDIDPDNEAEAKTYMGGLADLQTGVVGDITAGLPTGKDEEGNPTYDYSEYPYIEWYGDENGRVCIELAPSQIEIIGSPIPIIESDPVDRQQQRQNMEKFLSDMAQEFGQSPDE